MTLEEQVAGHLADAMLQVFELCGVGTHKEELTREEVIARSVYHHIHLAIRKMAKTAIHD